jgi:hypothetical protein
MFTSKIKFFRRKNRDILYKKYRYDYVELESLCKSFHSKLSDLDALISKYRHDNCIYEYLRMVRINAVNYRRETISYKYIHSSDDADGVYDVFDYSDLTDRITRIAEGVSMLRSAINFVGYLERENLTICHDAEEYCEDVLEEEN